VDDQPRNLAALEAVLESPAYNVVEANSGEEALKRLLQSEFAVILLDVMMPGMNGFETAELIRSREKTRYTPIVFLTAIGKEQTHVFRGYEVGAVDYLFKPIEPAVLRSKVAVFVELFQKTEQIRRQEQLLRELERIGFERRLEDARKRLEAERLHSEIRVAREIQQKFFPAAPLPIPGFDIGGGSYPAEATGGDYFDYIPLSDGTLAIAVGDVSGHGLGPALLMAEIRAYLRAFALTRSDVREIVHLLNQALVRDVPEDRFATLFFGQLDSRTRSLVYASAGHPTGYILDESGKVQAELKSTGMPLGILPEIDLDAAPVITLEPGQCVLLLTDGIFEARGKEEKLFGVDRVLDMVRVNRHLTGREIVDALYRAVCDFCRGRAQLDDMTTVVLKVLRVDAG
jgi:serine phosphatase RsbU (regulator of sigma subunit)